MVSIEDTVNNLFSCDIFNLTVTLPVASTVATVGSLSLLRNFAWVFNGNGATI